MVSKANLFDSRNNEFAWNTRRLLNQEGQTVPSGGDEGQVLKKNSGTDFDLVWDAAGGAGGGIEGARTKAITIDSPTSSENLTLFYADKGFELAEMRAVVSGSSPSIDWTVRYGADRSAAGTEVVTGGSTTTNTTTGQSITTFDNDTVPTGNYVWLETTGKSGTVDSLCVVLRAPSPAKQKSVIIDSPSASEDVTLGFTDRAITVTKMVMVLVGSSPSITWTLRHGSDRSAAGNEVVTGGTVSTSTTTGDVITTFNDETIAADSFLWFETSAVTNVSSMALSVIFTED